MGGLRAWELGGELTTFDLQDIVSYEMLYGASLNMHHIKQGVPGASHKVCCIDIQVQSADLLLLALRVILFYYCLQLLIYDDIEELYLCISKVLCFDG
jgi:hypothetical protein